MKKSCLFLLVFFLGLFVFNGQAFACKNKPRIDYAYAEEGILHIYGSHFSDHLGVKLGGEKLTLAGEREHNHIRAVIPDKFENGGTFRLVVYKKIKRRYWRSYSGSAQMDITLAATGQGSQPTKQNPPGDAGDTTPPTIVNIIPPTAELEFLQTHALVSFDVKDDNEVALIGIHNVDLPQKIKMVSAEPGIPNLSVSEEIPTRPGINTIIIWAMDIFGNVAKEMVTVPREMECVGCNLRALHMSGADFYAANLAGVVLSDSDLSEANLSMANLSKDDLGNKASLNGVKLSNAHLYDANMDSALLAGADLSGADLGKAILNSAIMIGANLSGAHLEGAVLKDANLANADLRGANLRGAEMDGTRGLDWAIFGNTICPDGSNSDESDSDSFTCGNNLNF